MNSKFFRTQGVYDGVTAITGVANELAFLVQGSEKAMLIDTLTGVGSLKALCRELTDLPLIVANTHGHVDHIGGNAEFERCYLHPLDMEMSYFRQMPVAKKMHFLAEVNVDLAALGMSADDFVKERPYYALPLAEGDRFDLGGGRILEVLHVPGHTLGSVAFLDIGARVAFIGDCLGTGLIHEGSLTVEEYIASLERFKAQSHRFDRMVWGHNNLERLAPAQIDTVIEVCREVLAGTDDADPVPPRFRRAKKMDENYLPLNGKWGNIVYDPERIAKL